MLPYRVAIFDFDGTLINSGAGIFATTRAVLDEMGFAPPSEDQLRGMVGPLLREGFRDIIRIPESRIDEAVELYRKWFKLVGNIEPTVYEGIPELLRALRANGVYTAIATARMAISLCPLCRNLGLLPLFDQICHPEPDTHHADKTPMIRKIIAASGAKPEECVMIGDRMFDMGAAQATGVTGVGILYGFGSQSELESSNAAYMVNSVSELSDLLLCGKNRSEIK